MTYNLIPKSKDGKYILQGCTLYYPLKNTLRKIKIEKFGFSLKLIEFVWVAECGDEYYNISDLYVDINKAKAELRDKINFNIKVLNEHLKDLDNV